MHLVHYMATSLSGCVSYYMTHNLTNWLPDPLQALLLGIPLCNARVTLLGILDSVPERRAGIIYLNSIKRPIGQRYRTTCRLFGVYSTVHSAEWYFHSFMHASEIHLALV